MTTIWLIASGTFGEAVRRKVLLVFLFVALAIMLMGGAFASFNPTREITVIKSLGLGVISLAGVFISVILYITLIPTEIERRTIYSILSKPVQRYQFLCGKFLGGLMTVLTNIALMGIVFILLVTFKFFQYGHPEQIGSVDLALAKGLLMIFFQLTLLGAVAMFFSVFLTPFVNFFLTFAVWLLGSTTLLESLSDPASDPQHPKNPLTLAIFKVLHVIVPNFSNYNINNPIINPHEHVTNEPVYIAWNILYALVYTAILLTIGTLIFDRREV